MAQCANMPPAASKWIAECAKSSVFPSPCTHIQHANCQILPGKISKGQSCVLFNVAQPELQVSASFFVARAGDAWKCNGSAPDAAPNLCFLQDANLTFNNTKRRYLYSEMTFKCIWISFSSKDFFVGRKVVTTTFKCHFSEDTVSEQVKSTNRR
jgi:hypothetical protein